MQRVRTGAEVEMGACGQAIGRWRGEIVRAATLGALVAWWGVVLACALGLRAGEVRAQGTFYDVISSDISNAEGLLSGRFKCVGKSMGSVSSYTGEVYVMGVGEVYLVMWDIWGSYYLGLGIEREGRLAVTFLTEDRASFGVALYQRDGEAWRGVWVRSRGVNVEREDWER
jgi:hypothetical protein